MTDQQKELERNILEALDLVRDPTGRTIRESGILLGLRGESDGLYVVCRDGAMPPPIRLRIEREVEAAILSMLPTLGRVSVEWQQVSAGQQSHSGHAHPHSGPAANQQPPKLQHIVAVGSGKGGVGKSTMAASLAYALKHRGFAVGLMDADVYGPSIPHILGVEHGPEVIQQPELRFIPPVRDGIKVISMGFLVAKDQAVVWRGPMLHKAVRDFLYAVEWGELDYLIVDLPPGTGDVVLSLSQQMPLTGGVIVCTPQEVALLDARKALHMFQTVRIPCLGVIENMSYFVDPASGNRSDIFGHGGARKWAEEAGVPFLGEVPIDVSIRIHGDEGRLRDTFASANPVRDNLIQVADHLLESVEAQGEPELPKVEVG